MGKEPIEFQRCRVATLAWSGIKRNHNQQSVPLLRAPCTLPRCLRLTKSKSRCSHIILQTYVVLKKQGTFTYRPLKMGQAYSPYNLSVGITSFLIKAIKLTP